MGNINPEALYPMLLHRFSDEFSRMDISFNFLIETLSILYMFHDPENKYNLPVKISEFSVKYLSKEADDKTASALDLFMDYYHSVYALMEDLESETKTERAVQKLMNISQALLELSGGYTDENRKAIASWLTLSIRGFIKRFKISMKNATKMQEHINKTFDARTANVFHITVGLVGKIGSESYQEADLILAISVLFILTSKVNEIRKTALSLETMKDEWESFQ